VTGADEVWPFAEIEKTQMIKKTENLAISLKNPVQKYKNNLNWSSRNQNQFVSR